MCRTHGVGGGGGREAGGGATIPITLEAEDWPKPKAERERALQRSQYSKDTSQPRVRNPWATGEPREGSQLSEWGQRPSFGRKYHLSGEEPRS